jgi:arylsulfatase A-like enzyme
MVVHNEELPYGEFIHKNQMTEKERAHAISLYDSEIYFTDKQIGRLLNYIEEKNKDNIIIITADHGESLGEHNYYYDHGDLLFSPSLHVPLIIKGINFPRKRINKLVRTVDIFTTLLGSLKINIDDNEFDGVDLVEVMKNNEQPLKAFSETGKAFSKEAYETGKRDVEGISGRLRSVIFQDRKLIYFPRKEGITWQLYDLKDDPEELNNIYETIPEIEIKELMDELKAIAIIPEKSGRKTILSEEDKKRLRALGYAE